MCENEGFFIAATEVDHVTPITGPDDPSFWDERNHQPLCKRHHSEKTAKEDHGFGH
jgi:5-methylcytosine-specific restriction enzyme A